MKLNPGASTQLVLPMAGSGKRFVDAGFQVPKPLLPVHDVRMFEVVLGNLLSPEVYKVVVICQKSWNVGPEIFYTLDQMGLQAQVIEVDYITDGPAATVALALPYLDETQPLVVANSDQYVDASLEDFFESMKLPGVDGCILTMEDSDPKWSYAKIDDEGFVTRVEEKKVISPFATVGIYGFKSARMFRQGFERMVQSDDRVNNEFYVAPIYNYCISDGSKITVANLGKFEQVMHGLGIPKDYMSFLSSSVSFKASDAGVKMLEPKE